MRVLLFGKDGQVGRALLRLSAGSSVEMIALGRAECDLSDASAVRAAVARTGADAVVNAAAYTAVDKAEMDREACLAVNGAAPAVIAREAARRGIPFLHYSTDYVFDGSKEGAYVEEDRTAPLNVYGLSKLLGEEGVAGSGARYAVLRTSWVYSNDGHNFLNTMLRLGAERPELRVVDDQRGAPTSADAIAAATLRILELDGRFPSGVYHMTAAGATTWRGFAEAIFAQSLEPGAPRPKVTPIGSADYPTPARRPRNSVLANDKFAQLFGFRLPEWREQLRAVLRSRERQPQLISQSA